MAQDMDHGYYANIVSGGAIWSLRVNDMHIRENVNFGHGDSSGSISRAVQPGRNTLSLIFSPITGKNPDTGEYEQSLKDDVSFEVSVERLDFKTRESQEINALHIIYDEERSGFITQPQTRFGEDRVLRHPLIWSDGQHRFSQTQTEKVILENGQTFAAYRIDLEFFVEDDQLWPQHWEAEAVPLEDTPEMRRELWAAYQDVHSLFQRGDTEVFFRMMEPSWARAAHIYTEYSSAREFIENVDGGLNSYKAVQPDGEVLQPLELDTDLQKAAVQIYGNGRLVWIRPDPFVWEHPHTGEITSVPVVFYKTAAGEWKIAEINIGL
ncbi:hypothetical protein [Leisingera sp. JC1]|uniref:hypothetical protein n=1 Tax=Leisingera sp. JC1 TaxID=1855282 RepID=UPI000803171A|nr:hypothetical protein [Leisingera sp. JC1]OBY28519.1 hypothetical protein A9D60_10760 [Leisingera sp. JC1]